MRCWVPTLGGRDRDTARCGRSPRRAPCVVSAAHGVGIAAHRGRDADLFMEDARVQRRRWPTGRARRPGLAGCDHREWVGEIAASIVAVGSQQGVLYDEIFAGVHLGGGAGRVLRRRGGRHPVLPAAARRGPR